MLDERSRNSRRGSLFSAILALRDSNPEHSGARALHHRLHICEVDVDEAGDGDDIRNTLHTLAQHVIREKERLLKRRIIHHHVQQSIVGDDDEGVHIGPELLDRFLSLGEATTTLECEGLSHHPDSQITGLT